MPKNKKAAIPRGVRLTTGSPPLDAQLPNGREVTSSVFPKDLHDLLDYLEGHYGDDEGRFDATYLWPWRHLTSQKRCQNERILRIVLKRLLSRSALFERHWPRLSADIQEHRRRQKTNGKLATANAAGIVVSAVVDALLPVREVSAKEMASTMANTSRAAAELFACLSRLRNVGMDLESLLPTEESIHRDDEDNGGEEYGGAYADARFFISMNLPRVLTREQRRDITEYSLKVIMRDPSVTLGILGRIALKAREFKARRHNLSGRQRFAHSMATHMVRDSIKFFGVPRYERAEAFAKAASGVQIKGLRQMMERERKKPATGSAKRSRIPMRGN